MKSGYDKSVLVLFEYLMDVHEITWIHCVKTDPVNTLYAAILKLYNQACTGFFASFIGCHSKKKKSSKLQSFLSFIYLSMKPHFWYM